MTALLITKVGGLVAVLVGLAVIANIFDYIFHHERHVDLKQVGEYSERLLELPEVDTIARDLRLCIKHQQYSAENYNSDCLNRRDRAQEIVEAIISCEQPSAQKVRLCEAIIPWARTNRASFISVVESLKVIGISKIPIDFDNCTTFDSLNNKILGMYWTIDAKEACIKRKHTDANK